MTSQTNEKKEARTYSRPALRDIAQAPCQKVAFREPLIQNDNDILNSLVSRRLLGGPRYGVSRSSEIHPNIMQLYGLVNTKGLRAMVFHDELVPVDQFLGRFRYSHILTGYIQSYCTSEWIHSNWTVWIRPATGELCVDLVRDPETNFPLMWMEIPRIGNVSLNDPRAEALIISGLN
ncbi:hypothetical protein B0H14DRAFT_3146702 [Mycena olivaceomarginata]|nr:hypothetical protein B0H14DRAFT_3146702 [Mycena olivaceomarginata]